MIRGLVGVAVPLLPPCPLPGCPGVTDDPRVPCGECLALFGPRLRPSDSQLTADEFAAESAAGDAQVRRALAAQAIIAACSRRRA